MSNQDKSKTTLLEQIVDEFVRTGLFPDQRQFRADNHSRLSLLEQMERDQILKTTGNGRYDISIEQVARTSHWTRERRIVNKVLAKLKELYVDDVKKIRSFDLLIPHDEPRVFPSDIQRSLYYLSKAGFIGGFTVDQSGAFLEVSPTEEVLKYRSIDDKIKELEHWRKQDLKARQKYFPPGIPGPRRFPSFSGSGKIDLSLLHPKILLASKRHYEDAHFREAILNAITAVFDEIRERSGVDSDGNDLVNRVFSLGRPLLKVNRLKTISDRNEQIGLMEMLKGAYTGIRNPKAHSLAIQHTTPVKAFEYIAFASLLMRTIENSKRVKRTLNN